MPTQTLSEQLQWPRTCCFIKQSVPLSHLSKSSPFRWANSAEDFQNLVLWNSRVTQFSLLWKNTSGIRRMLAWHVRFGFSLWNNPRAFRYFSLLCHTAGHPPASWCPSSDMVSWAKQCIPEGFWSMWATGIRFQMPLFYSLITLSVLTALVGSETPHVLCGTNSSDHV